MTDTHYCLDDSPWFRWVELDEVTSTNDFLRSYRPVGLERRITLVTAEYQTAGRGAGQNHWQARRGENLLFSLLVHPRHIGPERMFLLSEAMALAIRDAVAKTIQETEGAEQLKIKWPNDIYYGNRKLCGMLIENDLQGSCIERCILGVGINVNQKNYDANTEDSDTKQGFRGTPVSLTQIVGKEVERRFVLEGVMEHFDRYYAMTERGQHDELHQLYLAHLYRRGESCDFQDKDGMFRGTIDDVAPDGHLIVNDEKGNRREYAFKEIQFIIRNS